MLSGTGSQMPGGRGFGGGRSGNSGMDEIAYQTYLDGAIFLACFLNIKLSC